MFSWPRNEPKQYEETVEINTSGLEMPFEHAVGMYANNHATGGEKKILRMLCYF